MKHSLFYKTFLLAPLLLGTGCVKNMAVKALADELSGTGTAMSSDEDLEFIGETIPFALKLMEILHESTPEHIGLCDSLASGFTQYAMVYVLFPAEQQKYDNFVAYKAGNDRAKKMLLRARKYALEGMDLRYKGFSEKLNNTPEEVLALATTEDVSALYWLGASWLAYISCSKDDMEALGTLSIASAILQRALELDEKWDDGAIHEVLISLEPSLPGPGGYDRARKHFERAIELSGGLKASPYVSLATSVSMPNQDRDEFVELLNKAISVDVEADPNRRLANEYAIRQAAFLLAHVDDLFI